MSTSGVSTSGSTGCLTTYCRMVVSSLGNENDVFGNRADGAGKQDHAGGSALSFIDMLSS